MSRRIVADPTCLKVRDQMFLLTTNELSNEEAKVAYMHLADCPKCRKALAEHVTLAAALFGTFSNPTHQTA